MSLSPDTIRVLHVDDEPDFAELVATFLEREDERFVVETATSAEEGLDYLADRAVDCVVSDYEMPGLNGIEFLEAVREAHRSVPFVLYTGKGGEAVASEAISAGVTDYLQKGSGTSQYAVLANRIANAVEQYRGRLERRRRRERQDRQSDALLDLTTDDAVVDGDFDRALRRMTETAASVLDVDRVNVWLFDEDGDRLRCLDHFDRPTGAHDAGMELVAEHYPAYFEALASNRSIAADDAAADPRMSELAAYLDEHDVGAMLDATIRSEGEVVGVICHEHVGDTREWTDDETEFASDVAELVHRALRNSGGTTDGSGAGADVEGERELERTRDLLEQTERIADVGGWELDVETMEVFWTDHLFDLMGVEGEEEPSLDEALDVYHGDDRAAVEAGIQGALDDGDPFDLEARYRRPDGEIRWLHVSGTPAVEDGEVVTLRGAVQDITERRTRERVLRDTYDVISDQSQSFEEQVRALLELGRAELDTRYGTLSEIRGEDYVFEVVAADDDRIQAGDVVPLSTTNCEIAASEERTLVLGDVDRDASGATVRSGSTDLDVSCYLGAPVFVDDEVYGTFCFYDTEPRADQFSQWEQTFVDLTSRWVSYELQRRQANERLQEKNDQLKEFASIVSHDLRNPLTVAGGHLERAAEECPSEHLADVARAHDRMAALIDDLLTLARQGDQVGETEAVDLAALSETCWRNVATPRATLRTELDRTIRADRRRLQQLLENLVRNSVEHAGEDVTVTVRELDDGFAIEDDGPGVPPEERDEVFEAGYSTHRDGTGFGLSIVEQVAAAHGWEVRVTDGAAGGARFEITGVEFPSEAGDR